MGRNLSVQAELERNLKANKREAYEYFYDHYAPVLYGTIQSIVKDEIAAIQLFEEAYLHFWYNISQYDSQQCSMVAWALRICRKKAMEYQQLNINNSLIK